MRIIAGSHRGRKLSFTTTDELRPTKDRVRESLFSILGNKCSGAHVLDCYSGSGSLGLEALSRGADHATFVDIQPKYTEKNAEMFDEESYRVLTEPVTMFLEHCSDQFDLIFIDPPWRLPEEYSASLMAISRFDILRPNGWVILEHPKSVVFQLPVSLEVKTERSYGNTVLTILKGAK